MKVKLIDIILEIAGWHGVLGLCYFRLFSIMSSIIVAIHSMYVDDQLITLILIDTDSTPMSHGLHGSRILARQCIYEFSPSTDDIRAWRMLDSTAVECHCEEISVHCTAVRFVGRSRHWPTQHFSGMSVYLWYCVSLCARLSWLLAGFYVHIKSHHIILALRTSAVI